jgi:putative endonuclease
MHHVYVLYSLKYDKIYIGESSNLGDRFISHNLDTNKGWTSRYRPWVLVYAEKCEDKSAALKREKELKSAAGRRWVREEIVGQTFK